MGHARVNMKEDYWYYDPDSDGFYYEHNGTRGWRKRNPKLHAQMLLPVSAIQKHVLTKNCINKIEEQQPWGDQNQIAMAIGPNQSGGTATSKFFPGCTAAPTRPTPVPTSVHNFK